MCTKYLLGWTYTFRDDDPFGDSFADSKIYNLKNRWAAEICAFLT